MRYLHSKYEHYCKFVEKHKTDRLFKNLKITTNFKEDFVKKLKLNEEIFNKEIPTQYNIELQKSNEIVISFYTNKNNKYRLDIIIINEDDKFINHIGFSDFNTKNSNEYDNPTKRDEMIEIMNRIHYILRELLSKKLIINYFCIGITSSLVKNNIYEYFLKIVVGEDGFDKLPTTHYPTGFGLYFKI